ncbi:fungal-specific transcription factor domain-containing protein [Aspergillus filifer]
MRAYRACVYQNKTQRRDTQSYCRARLDSDIPPAVSGGSSRNHERITSQSHGNGSPHTTFIQSSSSPISHNNPSLVASISDAGSPDAAVSSSSNITRRGSDGFEDRATLEDYLNKLAVWPNSIPKSVEEHLINIYFDNANIRWPFLLKRVYHTWHAAWRQGSQEGRAKGLWQGFFVNMLFAVSLLLDPKSPSSVLSTSRNFYDQAVGHYLPLVLKTSSRLLHVQAYLIMAIHAIFSPSTEQIVLTVSAAVRYCVLSQFHLVEAEPELVNNEARLEVQMRRRAFWSSYALDRLACGVFRLPYSIADDTITVPLFDNIDDSRLCERTPISDGSLVHTSVSSTLHRERCLRIQSEILNMTTRPNYSLFDPDAVSTWRSYILSKLENWRSNLQEAADTNSKRPTDERWLQITYNLCLLLLHMPNKINVRGPAGDWALQASLQTITIFRKFQGYKTIPHPWLGLVSQFSVGVTMLYCLWATPPKFRTDAYNAKSILAATRACSNNLTIIAERWEQAKDLLDVFELLATEIPLVEQSSSAAGQSGRAVTRIGEETVNEIREKLPAVSSIVLNRDVLGMIEQMITEDFPRDDTIVESGPEGQPNTSTTGAVSTGPIFESTPLLVTLYPRSPQVQGPFMMPDGVIVVHRQGNPAALCQGVEAVAKALGGKAGGKGTTIMGSGPDKGKMQDGIAVAAKYLENLTI